MNGLKLSGSCRGPITTYSGIAGTFETFALPNG